MNKIVFLASAVAGLLFALSACNSSPSSDASSTEQLKGSISIDGSSTVYPLTEAVAEEYRFVESKVKVSVGSSGSGAGFKKFARGESDISNASRAIKDKEKNACAENDVDYQEIRVALDGIALVVNPENSWASELTTDELKRIWEPGSEVKTWADVRSEWPAEEIRLFGPSTAHGTYDFFTEEIMGESGASRPDYSAVADYNVAVQGIAQDKYSLGYFGLAYYEENKDKLKLLGIDNGNGSVRPSLETVKNGSYSPLARPLFIYVSGAAAARPEIHSFVSFYLENAGELAKEVGYIPLPESDYQAATEAFGEFSQKRSLAGS